MDYRTWDISKLIEKGPDIKGPLNVLPDQFCGLVIGSPNAGKTTLVAALLRSKYGLCHKFDLTLFISPYEIKQLDVKKDRWCKILNVAWIKDRVRHFKTIKKVEKVFIFVDDCVSTISKGAKQEDITNLFFNRRKLIEGVEISIIVTTQKYTRFPADFRSSCDFHILFNLPNNDLDTVARELSDNHITFKAICKAHWNDKPQEKPFIYLRRAPEYKLFLNFEETA